LYFSAMNAQLSNAVAYGHRKVYVYRKNNPNSGTTVREVSNGVNALENINYIKEHLAVKSDKTINAANWHIWMNNFMLITYIVGANAQKEYKKEFNDAKKYVRRNCLNVLLHSDVRMREKIKIIGFGLAPVFSARYIKRARTRRFKKDMKSLSNS